MSSNPPSEAAGLSHGTPALTPENQPAAASGPARPVGGTAVGRPRPTLRHQLVARITLIVTAFAIMLAALSTFLVSRIMINSLDQQLLYAIGATDDSPHGPQSGNQGGRPEGAGDLRVGGLPSGSISLVIAPNGSASATVLWEYGSAKGFTLAFEARMSLDDIVPSGQSIRGDLTSIQAIPAPDTNPTRED